MGQNNTGAGAKEVVGKRSKKRQDGPPFKGSARLTCVTMVSGYQTLQN